MVILSRNGSATVLPWLMLSRVSMIAFSTTLLPAVFPVIAKPSRIGTPELRSSDMFCEKRATATFRRRSPMIGMRSISESIFIRPIGVL